MLAGRSTAICLCQGTERTHACFDAQRQALFCCTTHRRHPSCWTRESPHSFSKKSCPDSAKFKRANPSGKALPWNVSAGPRSEQRCDHHSSQCQMNAITRPWFPQRASLPRTVVRSLPNISIGWGAMQQVQERGMLSHLLVTWQGYTICCQGGSAKNVKSRKCDMQSVKTLAAYLQAHPTVSEVVTCDQKVGEPWSI